MPEPTAGPGRNSFQGSFQQVHDDVPPNDERPQVAFEQLANPIIRGDLKLMHLKYFFTRKLLFVKESDAVALFPGGFGTLDEGFEVLTLVQTGKSQLFPIVMVDAPGGDYWAPMLRFI